MSRDGGTAFPIQGAYAEHQDTGMTLRDYFAAKALQGELAAPSVDGSYWTPNTADKLASRCYRFADAMLKARQQQD